jgi:uncharacterized protein YkwD
VRKAALTCLSIAVPGVLLAVTAAQAQANPPSNPRSPSQATPQSPPELLSDPELLSVKIHQAPERRREASVRVRAVDRSAPLSGVSVLFPDGGLFGLSACRAPTSDGRQPGPPFSPGSRVNFSFLHHFRTAPMGSLLLRLDSSGCSGPVNSVFRPFTFSPKSPAHRPRGSATAVRSPRRARVRGRRCPRGRIGRTRASLRVARRTLLCTLNAMRLRGGLRPLRSNRRLLRASVLHSRAMINASFFSHIEPAGIGLLQRVRKAGYLAGAHQWLVGENIGFGRGAHAAPSGMVRAWMGSTGHRANILAPQFREVGLGIVPGTPGRPGGRGATYTTDFGVRR